ncbi:transcriptional regulator with XRE-family HTH domain [Streptomonospora salina]|uniref:Transcriptional regulator with XRE-family HTH domain n=2 Tax=Streptomonospora salina TaxID=104205 RepID=A0A841E9S6_9ACTN|nr:helix-turn-helix transcriptional regulator [Streptomonospora salina]MBB5999875.1 transcriptional regulator with XRE-family HTH domain [Streptomonospora salina]
MMVRAEAEIGLFLKAHRDALSPEDAGLPDGGSRRRVPGLRREEVARLAGVSVDYYTRIEQGRGGAVSAEVLDVLAGALQLSESERVYLRNVADRRARRPRGAPCSAQAGEEPEMPRQSVRREVRFLIDTMEAVPALVLGRGMDLLAWNRMAERLWPGIGAVPPEELNIARLVFLHPHEAGLHLDPEGMRHDVAAKLRSDSGRCPQDLRLCRVIADLRRDSPRFRELWEAREVREHLHGSHRLGHPAAGELELYFEKMPLPDARDQILLTYTAAPGSVSDERLRLLASAGAAVG